MLTPVPAGSAPVSYHQPQPSHIAQCTAWSPVDGPSTSSSGLNGEQGTRGPRYVVVGGGMRTTAYAG